MQRGSAATVRKTFMWTLLFRFSCTSRLSVAIDTLFPRFLSTFSNCFSIIDCSEYYAPLQSHTSKFKNYIYIFFIDIEEIKF